MVKVTYFGHACFSITDGESSVIIDPFLTGNPSASTSPDKITADAILLTHGHGDHFGDTVAIAKRTGAFIIAPYELAIYCERKGLKSHPMHIGGSRQFPFGKVKLTPAWHGSAIIGDTIEYTGSPCGFLLTMNGKTIYHSGDTGLFGDMELIGRLQKIDLALLPIGDNFVMGVDDAAEATRMIKPGKVVPMHYNTFDVIKADPEEFRKKVKTICECIILKPGESVDV
ncbi:MAG: metal-dependent hydrolase [Candidatus Eisenbacteria bacterium]|nr:metal-dependent hydrolase [Candidatus Eisenbacteria bacterium]